MKCCISQIKNIFNIINKGRNTKEFTGGVMH